METQVVQMVVEKKPMASTARPQTISIPPTSGAKAST